MAVLIDEPPIGGGDALGQRNARLPAQCPDQTDVGAFARRAVRLASVQHDVAAIADGPLQIFCKLTDRGVDAGPDVAADATKSVSNSYPDLQCQPESQSAGLKHLRVIDLMRQYIRYRAIHASANEISK